MAVDIDDEDEINRSSGSQSLQRLFDVLDPIRSSFPLQLAAAGLLFILVGFIINSGVWAGVLPIWGAAFVLCGVGAYVFIRNSQRGTRG